MKFLFVCTHQIQNLIPLFKELNNKKDLSFKVLYWEKLYEDYYDKGFDKIINFNIDSLKGYIFDSLSDKQSKAPNLSFFNKLIVSFKLIKYLIKKDSDVVLFYSYIFPHVIASIFAKILGKKTIIRTVSYNLGRRNIFKKIARYIYYKFANLFFDEFWSVHELNTSFFLSFGAKKDKISLIYPSQITYDFVVKENDKFLLDPDQILASNNLPKNKKFILHAGKFIKRKRPIFLLEAFMEAKLSDEWVLLLAGGGGVYHNDVLSFLTKNNLNNVKFLGYKNLKEIVGLYKLSDILVAPSDYGETLPNVLMEAIQFGCALITSDRSGLHNEVSKEKIGLVFDSNKKNELVDHLKLLTNDENVLKNFKENAIKYSEKIKPQYIANQIQEALKKI